MEKKSFLDRFIERIDAIDANSLQAYILHLSRERGLFETVFNAVQEGILVIDRHLKIQYFNNAARELLGLPDDIRRVRLSQMLPGIDWKRVLQLEAEEWVKLSRQEIEIAYPVHRYVQFYLVPNAEVKGFATVILRDVTESRQRTMEELEAARKQVVALLAAGVAHEIGNPLNSLYLNLQLLQRMAASEDELDRTEVREMIDACTGEVERLDHIIHQFLQAFRPGAGQLVPVDILALLQETVLFMQRELEDKNVEVKFIHPPDLPPVMGDAAQLKQAFYNILRNAMQAMGNGGVLSISASGTAAELKLEFADSGHGITPGQLNRIFDPFKSFRNGGNGIGMMIIERVLREHGAELQIETVPGDGTTLVIRFPRHGRRMRMLPCQNQKLL